MTNEEYKSFLKYVFHEYTEKRLHRLGKYFDKQGMHHEWRYEWRRLMSALHLMRYIQDVCNDKDDVYSTFRLERLRSAIGEIEDGLRWHNRLAEEAGFFDAWDAFYDEIVDGIRADLMPESELDLMKQLGFSDPKTDIEGIIYSIKMRAKVKHKNNNNLHVSSRLNHVVDELTRAQQDFQESIDELKLEKRKDTIKKERRWFKGLGQIGQGAALSIGDIALAVGGLNLPVSAETQTWGAIVSATTGIGMIFNGIGDLRGE